MNDGAGDFFGAANPAKGHILAHLFQCRGFFVAEPIEHGRGKIRVDDTTWKIEGEDSPAGSQVRVIGVDGVMLRVERVTD